MARRLVDQGMRTAGSSSIMPAHHRLVVGGQRRVAPGFTIDEGHDLLDHLVGEAAIGEHGQDPPPCLDPPPAFKSSAACLIMAFARETRDSTVPMGTPSSSATSL